MAWKCNYCLEILLWLVILTVLWPRLYLRDEIGTVVCLPPYSPAVTAYASQGAFSLPQSSVYNTFPQGGQTYGLPPFGSSPFCHGSSTLRHSYQGSPLTYHIGTRPVQKRPTLYWLFDLLNPRVLGPALWEPPLCCLCSVYPYSLDPP